MSPVEIAVLGSVRWLLGGILAAVPLLLIPVPVDPMGIVIGHLVALVILGLALTARLLTLVDSPRWYGDLRPRLRMFATAASVTVIVTGVVGLVTLATSAALRLAPSLQFLQLLSALDIAWSVTALVIGVYWLRGRGPALVAGTILGVVCVWSIWRYLDRVGFGSDGGWIVDGDALRTLVIPFDTAAAVMAVGLVLLAIRRRTSGIEPEGQATEQPSAQS